MSASEGIAPGRREPRVSDFPGRLRPEARAASVEDFRNVGFVIMPFGMKGVGTRGEAPTIDFDAGYESLFRPAIEAVVLPEAQAGGRLQARRTDKEFFAGHMSQAMF